MNKAELIEKIAEKEGEVISFDTLLLANGDGKEVKIGKPKVNANVKGKILKHGRADKVLVVKYKAKTRYKKRVGHRQSYTQIQIQEV